MDHQGFTQAWAIRHEAGRSFLRQGFSNLGPDHIPLSLSTHPMIISGDTAWRDITFEALIIPETRVDKSGLVFGYHSQNDFYFFGLEGASLVIKKISTPDSPRRPGEILLASRSYERRPMEELKVTVTIRRNRITTSLNDSIHLYVEEEDYRGGQIGFLSDLPARFYQARVKILNVEQRQIARRLKLQERRDELLRRDYPEMVVWKTFQHQGILPSPNLRLGDLTGDGNKELVLVKPGEDGGISGFLVMNLDGDVLWSSGRELKPDEECHREELPAQVHDLDGDGDRELIYVSNGWVYVLEGRSGKRIRRSRVAGGMEVRSLQFADLKGTGRDNCLLLSDQRNMLLALDERGRFLWMQKSLSGCQPLIYDLDGDGRDEVLMGYSIYASEGELIRSHDEFFTGSCKGVSLSGLRVGEVTIPSIIYAAGEDGLVYFSLDGSFLKQKVLGHVSYIGVCNFNLEDPGYELVTSNSMGSKGLVHMLDASGEVLGSFLSPSGTNRCVSVNWKGDGEEFLITSANQRHGGLYDQGGMHCVWFPADDHPETYYRAADLIGDSRDEIIVWDRGELWIFTQEDNPRMRYTYDPLRRPSYNFSMHAMNYSVEKNKPF